MTTEAMKNNLFNSKNKSSDPIHNIPTLADQVNTSQESYNAKFDNNRVSSNAIEDQKADSSQLISITLDNVKAYDNNTRTSPNESYNDIKESIRVRGLDNKPTITKRPGDEQYMIMNGGNTRLQALNDLYQETQEKIQNAKDDDQSLVIQLQIEAERYFKHKWEFKEYISELDCFSGHVIENEQRGGTLFIDKALSINKYRQFFLNDVAINIDINNSREVAAEISKNGWPISHTIVSIMVFAIEYLYPFIPNLMHTGLSKVKTLELRKIKKSYESYINKLNNDSITISHFAAIWESALVNNDSDDIKSYNILNIRSDLDDAIKLRSGIALFSTSSQIDNLVQSNDEQNNIVKLVVSDVNEPDANKKFNTATKDQLSEQSNITTEANNSVNLSTDNNEITDNDADSIWAIVYNDVIKLANSYNFDNCLSNSDKYPGFFIDNHDSMIYSDTDQERIAIWIWLRSLCFNDSKSLLSGSKITIIQAFELTLFLYKERINNNKIQRLLNRVEKSIMTVEKLLSN